MTAPHRACYSVCADDFPVCTHGGANLTIDNFIGEIVFGMNPPSGISFGFLHHNLLASIETIYAYITPNFCLRQFSPAPK